jgi:hypothetical protein
MSDDDLLTMIQAAEIAGVLQQTIYRATKEGRLPCVEKYGKKLIRPADLQLYMDTLGERNGYRAKTGLAPAKRRRPGRPSKDESANAS